MHNLAVLVLCFASGGRGAPGRDQVEPLHESGVLDGVRWGVTAIQGRRPYMEDMHQASLLPASCKAAGVTHFFAVFDGHGGSSVAQFCESTFVEQLRDTVSRRYYPRAGGWLYDQQEIDHYYSRNTDYSRSVKGFYLY